MTTHGAARSYRQTLEYRSWIGMKERCSNPKNKCYASYGGRGIRVCDRWISDFSQFLADMGPKPSPKHSIDRIDNDGHYEPANCRWATTTQQVRNSRRTRLDPRKVRAIRLLVGNGFSRADVASWFGIHETYVGVLFRRRSWIDVESPGDSGASSSR